MTTIAISTPLLPHRQLDAQRLGYTLMLGRCICEVIFHLSCRTIVAVVQLHVYAVHDVAIPNQDRFRFRIPVMITDETPPVGRLSGMFRMLFDMRLGCFLRHFDERLGPESAQVADRRYLASDKLVWCLPPSACCGGHAHVHIHGIVHAVSEILVWAL